MISDTNKKGYYTTLSTLSIMKVHSKLTEGSIVFEVQREVKGGSKI